MREARGRYCLLLNEDSELRPGAAAALVAALEADPSAAAAGAQLLDSDGNPVPCAWRFPGVGTALAGAVFLHRLLTVQSRGERDPPRRLGAVERPAGPPRGGGGGRLPGPGLLRLLRRVRLLPGASRDAGWHTLFVPAAEAVHHDQLSTDLAAGLPRIVEFHRNRDLYMRKHHGAAAALAVRVLTAWSYALRALAATVLPNQPGADLLGPRPSGVVPRTGREHRATGDSISP